MGEETASRAPFLFFTDYPRRAGRLRCAKAGAASSRASRRFERRGRFPIPTRARPSSAARSGADAGDAASSLSRRCWRCARREIVPRLRRRAGRSAPTPIGDAAVLARWRLGDGAVLAIAANLGDAAVPRSTAPAARCLFEPRRDGGARMATARRPQHGRLPRAGVMSDEAILRARSRGGHRGRLDRCHRAGRSACRPQSLQRILDALRCRAGSAERAAAADRARSAQPHRRSRPCERGRCRPSCMLEDGSAATPCTIRAGTAVPAIDEPGYHTLRFGGREITLAVAPPRCVTVERRRAGRAAVGPRGADLRPAPRRRRRHRRFRRRARCWPRRPRARAPTRVALSPVHACSPPTRRASAPTRRRAGCSSIRCYVDPATVLGEQRVAEAAADSSRRR